MRRGIHLFIATLLANAMLILLALPSYAQEPGYYPGPGEDYYGGEGYGPRDGVPPPEDRPALAYTYSPRLPGGEPYAAAGYNGDYRPPYAAYSYGYRKPRYPRYRKTCVYGPLRYKKVCDYEPPRCWRERECYVIHGKKYCRHFTKCVGGDRYCRWVRKYPYGGGESYCGGGGRYPY